MPRLCGVFPLRRDGFSGKNPSHGPLRVRLCGYGVPPSGGGRRASTPTLKRVNTRRTGASHRLKPGLRTVTVSPLVHDRLQEMNYARPSLLFPGLFLVAISGLLAADLPLPPGIVVAHSSINTAIYLGSPSLTPMPGGTLVVAYDLFGPGSSEDTTRIVRSTNRGESWERGPEIKGAFWSSLFPHRGALYLLGASKHDGAIVIRRSMDGGRGWTEPHSRTSGLLFDDAPYHGAPVPVLEHQGRIWRAFEDGNGPGGWGAKFRVIMISAPADADLLAATNWTMSKPVNGEPSWLGGHFGGWLEGNAVIGPEGNVLDLLRVDYRAYPEKAAIVTLSPDGKTAAFDPRRGFIDFPGGCKKFTIRRDPSDRTYWALSNFVPASDRGGNVERTRNTLALIHSSDLRSWTVRSILLRHPERDRHGFQYADWHFDGDDLIAVVRTAFDDAEGGAANCHDSNFITFHRWPRFRELTARDSAEQVRDAR